jgi:hypothetical protein
MNRMLEINDNNNVNDSNINTGNKGKKNNDGK